MIVALPRTVSDSVMTTTPAAGASIGEPGQAPKSVPVWYELSAPWLYELRVPNSDVTRPVEGSLIRSPKVRVVEKPLVTCAISASSASVTEGSSISSCPPVSSISSVWNPADRTSTRVVYSARWPLGVSITIVSG